jgi:aminopeptidase N
MNNLLLVIFLHTVILLAHPALAQPAKSQPDLLHTTYQPSAPRINDLIHTKLAVRFDYNKRYLYGQAWLTLTPHAYPSDSLRLDAKGMEIKTVALWNGTRQQLLQYDYSDENNLRLNLGREIQPGQQYIVYIEYTAKPEELKLVASPAIPDVKGLFFVNPDSAEKGKPVQIWTQGEMESNSVWFPTIDRPNQKTTSEISLTVPSKYLTLSNGALVSQATSGPGLRTDTWKMDQPHAPYLVMFAVGDFRLTKDTWRDKEVSYYLEPSYAPYARQLFGKAPQMLEFISTRLGVTFPWNKYAQVVVRDYHLASLESGRMSKESARSFTNYSTNGLVITLLARVGATCWLTKR